MLIEAGAVVNPEPPGDRTPLGWAIYDGQDEIISLLMEAGADPTAIDARGPPKQRGVGWGGV